MQKLREPLSRRQGQLRVHAMSGIGQYYAVDAIAEYRRKHPKVTFDLIFANRVPDLLDELPLGEVKRSGHLFPRQPLCC
ncbi:LysR substrate-binding domain-containing protein [Burkholderia cenocepacia]|uniref:LysR substrate-binding domain-containing protein n=1 Tax=Burkholderia cenocepacia TaxID=95486 RepID=UPI002857441F|nr:LysR substrate-binding domain-containing protein [Burkholderia cenocepacia]MDR8071394.1 hypothetical protein [Burkholderia cenocepacia]